ncbi:hypothetical protein [Neobacillus soli]|nr:hypothetical protein [Neobacillus soli]
MSDDLNFNGNCREAVEFYAHAFGTNEKRIGNLIKRAKEPFY